MDAAVEASLGAPPIRLLRALAYGRAPSMIQKDRLRRSKASGIFADIPSHLRSEDQHLSRRESLRSTKTRRPEIRRPLSSIQTVPAQQFLLAVDKARLC